MRTRTNIVTIAVLALVTLLLTTAWNVFAHNGTITGPGKDYEESIQYGSDLEWSPVGSWVVRLPWAPFLFWRTITPQDLTGNRYGGFAVRVTYAINPPDPNEKIRDDIMVSQTVRTGPNSFETIDVLYATKEGEGYHSEVSHIWIGNAKWTLTGPDTYEGDYIWMTYLGDQDADGDGFPDEGQDPVATMPFTVEGKRLRVTPPFKLPRPEGK